MEYLNQAKANLAAMQQAVAVQAQQEQMAMLLRERISQIDQMVAEPAEPVPPSLCIDRTRRLV